jgi:hypothetical protein
VIIMNIMMIVPNFGTQVCGRLCVSSVFFLGHRAKPLTGARKGLGPLFGVRQKGTYPDRL